MAEIDERYEVLEELGRGARGVVCKARDRRIGRLVALKAIRPEAGLSPDEEREFFQRFHREALTAGNLTHPNIVTIYDIYEDPVKRTSYISMEYIRGQSLQQLIDDGRIFSVEDALKIAIQVAAGLDFAHRRGVIHRDIKPANLILDTEERLIVTDFSVARIASSDLTRDGQFMGTPSFIAPEQITGGAVGPRSDLFSLAVVFYQLLTSERPFIGDNVSTVLYKIVHRDPPPPSLLNAAVNPDIDAVVAMGLDKNPDKRYQEASWFKEDLVSLIRGQTPKHAVGDRPEAPAATVAMPPTHVEELTRTARSLAILVTAFQRAFHLFFRVDLLAKFPRWVRNLDQRVRWSAAGACCLLLAGMIFSWAWFGRADAVTTVSLMPENPLIERVQRPSDVWFDESRYRDDGPGCISYAAIREQWQACVIEPLEAEERAEEAARLARERERARRKAAAKKSETEPEQQEPVEEPAVVPEVPSTPVVIKAAELQVDPTGTLELVLHHSFPQGTVTVKAGDRVIFSSAINATVEDEASKGKQAMLNLKRRFRQEEATFSGIPVPSGHNELAVFLEVPGKDVAPVSLGAAFEPDEKRRLHVTYGRLKGKKVTYGFGR